MCLMPPQRQCRELGIILIRQTGSANTSAYTLIYWTGRGLLKDREAQKIITCSSTRAFQGLQALSP
jgi:hypothetical protein